MLRLYPPAYVVARAAVGPDRFEDLEIREGDRLQIAIFMLHRKACYWDDPAAFRPDRFRAAPRHPFAFIPFGGGLRICLGLAIARLEAQLLLAELLRAFELSPSGPPPSPLGKATLRTVAPVRTTLRPRD